MLGGKMVESVRNMNVDSRKMRPKGRLEEERVVLEVSKPRRQDKEQRRETVKSSPSVVWRKRQSGRPGGGTSVFFLWCQRCCLQKETGIIRRK